MNTRRYYPGLNALRAYAALSVVWWHVSQWANITFPLQFLFLDGSDAVTLFFVLSGFLIGSLLLEELRQTGTIDLAHFYQRRIRRIMPLYYLVIVLTILLTPQYVTWQSLILTILFLRDLTPSSTAAFGVYWSLAVEERFYLCIPYLLKRFSVPFLVVCVLIGRAALMLAFASNSAVTDVLGLMRFDAMALGVFGAWLVTQDHPFLKQIYRLELPAVLLLAAVIIRSPVETYFYDLAFALISFVVILTVATKPRSLLRIRRGVLDSIGQYSYGIYLYHSLFISLANFMPMTAFIALGALPAAILYVVVYYGFVIGGTLIAARFSYFYFEQRFLSSGSRTKVPLAASQS